LKKRSGKLGRFFLKSLGQFFVSLSWFLQVDSAYCNNKRMLINKALRNMEVSRVDFCQVIYGSLLMTS